MSSEERRFRVECSGCEAGFKIKRAGVGKKATCPKCGVKFEALPVVKVDLEVAPASPQVSSPTGASLSPGDATSGLQSPETPAGMIRCVQCHEFVPESEFMAHRRTHAGKREDGQHNQYPSLPPEERYRGSLDGVPQFYRHNKCGAVTGMPEEIMRTYLVDPYFYGYSSYCSGCETHIRATELIWTETGQNMMDYTRQLQDANPNQAELRKGVIKTLVGGAVVGGGLLGGLVALIAFFMTSMFTAFLTFVMVGILGSLGLFFVLLNMRGGI